MNKDILNAKASAIAEDIENGNVKEFSNKIVALVDEAQKEVMDKYNALKDADEVTLQMKGVRKLNTEEKKFYDGLISSIRNEGEGVQGIPNALPVTVVDRIFEDLVVEHPLLKEIDFINSRGLTDWLLTDEYTELYSWDNLCDAITSENNASIVRVQFGQFKLSAWMPVCLTAIELGQVWLDLYVRTILKNALALGLTEAILKGNGQKKPVGMTKTVNVKNQTVPAVDKQAITVNDLKPATIGGILSTLSNGGKRNVSNVIAIVNPVTYYTKVMPAITVLATNGMYTSNLPFPIKFIIEPAMDTDKVIFGLPKQYFATVGLGKEGRITSSDDFKFLDDVRVFKAKIVAYGTPKDDTSFVVADVSGMTPAVIEVKSV